MEAADMPRKKAATEVAKAAPAEQTQLDPREKKAMTDAFVAYKQRPVRVSVEWRDTPDGFRAHSPHDAGALHSAHMMNAMGTASPAFMIRNFQSLEAAVRARNEERGDEAYSINAALALVEAIAPQDELEGSLALQIASNHALTMEMLCRAKSTSDVEHLQMYGNMAVKLQRTFTAQIEALAKMRGKGQQTVRVEHVTVAPGGQAIVGDVHHYGRGAASQSRNEDQSHATGNSGGGPALPSPNPIGEAVPIASGEGPEAVPHARRHKPRRASGKSTRD
ncbi:hypothetical protein N6H05_07505 [Sphingobium sp. WTD-1]|uniref:hypothetical protein n=1 Tax=Sphingobium sp. WTD-1 TaxID=2979467 RepID=UPI0024DDFE96|nr:hypothetical protein [Sphingobium sp. WTD-1]WIA57634.1 hypothetical protein N6H05_07505 [Sphingobium sp. WTD-1]